MLVTYTPRLHTKNSSGTMQYTCKPYVATSASTYWSGLTVCHVNYEPETIQRQTVAFGERDAVVGFRKVFTLEFQSTTTGIACYTGSAAPEAGNFSGLSTVLGDACVAGNYLEISLDNGTTFYGVNISEYAQGPLDEALTIGLKIRMVLRARDLQTSNMNTLGNATF